MAQPQLIGDPIVDVLSIFSTPSSVPQVPSVPAWTAEDDRRLRAELEASSLQRQTVIQEKLQQSFDNGMCYVMPRARAATASSMSHELSYRAWRAVAEALVRAATGAGGHQEADAVAAAGPEKRLVSAVSLPVATAEVAARDPKARAALTVENVGRLAAVEQWRQMARAIMGDYAPAEGDEGKISYFVVSSIRQDGTDAKPVTDLVGDFERRQPGMMADIAKIGQDALRELQKAGLAPADMELRLDAAAQTLRDMREKDLADLQASRARAVEYRDALQAQLDQHKARIADLDRDPGKPPMFGRGKWEDANQRRMQDLAAAKQAKAEAELKLDKLGESLRDSAATLERIERDLRLGVPEVAAIALAGVVPADAGSAQPFAA